MKMPLVAVLDKKTGAFGAPSPLVHLAEGIREFERMRTDKTTKIGMYPEDFDFWKVGDFDPQTGEITADKLQLMSGIQ